jgi:Na+-transporting methylmalonyl-CoA/oxaloacetate decarboxylase gamma subunit
MSKKNKRPLQTVIFLGVILGATIAWIVIYAFFLSGVFRQLSASAVVDLSKTLIQSIGILVSLIIASSFVYIGKMDELTIRIFSKENDLDNKQEAIRDTIGGVTESLQECSTRLSKLENNKLNESDLQTKKKLEKTLSELENHNKEHTEFLKKTVKLGINEDINAIESTKGLAIGFLAFDIGFFLISILTAIVAFVFESGRLLGDALIFIVMGMINVFAVWYIFYGMSKLMREFFRIILSTKTTLNVISKCAKDCKDELDDISDAITAISKT